ncbi:cellulase family glycosylhydrolase [Fibrobacter sp. UWB13]|uniref:cellulase family glycosylhydrolase n=1 Tax=Fibrobacter sp. UWB13 TaxID=1896204 RepID=UPI000A0C63FC|nr:cellulase family glycosylhydrolase [Fibrobacter sp. UWB13]SMG33256.1 endoglucanase [Fibrobacter sp. UWB13]
MKLTKLLTGVLAGAAISAFAADASTAIPRKAGPVSYYGALHTSGSKIIGAKNNQQAMLRGVSLFWSDATGASYYNPTVISWAVDNLKIDVFRYAMAIQYYDSNGGTKNEVDKGNSYAGAPEGQLSMIDKMVKAAIENDVYIIIDWHSHRAHLETSIAKTFFETVSKKYKDVPNVIYEIYNEPVSGSGGDWGAIKNYANQIVPAIRNNTQNLVIVGTPNWSQHPEQGARDPIASTNIAYVLHFYASTHSKGSFGGNVSSALSAGYPVFISEWGTTNADGDGEPNASATSEWTSFMDQNMIPNCNWSLRQQTSDVDQKSEKSAIFAGDKSLITAAALDAATYTSSGNIIKSYLTKNARSWADSLVKGKNTGSCAFKATTAKQTDGKISGVLKSGCTYTSSNDKIASVSGSDIVINDYGFVTLKGNDGSESVVTITQVAGQTIANLEDITCNYTNTCKSTSKTGRAIDFDGDGSLDYLLTMDDKTNEGSKFTLTSLDPSIVTVSKTTCTNNSCANSQKNKQVWMLHFKSYGTAKVVASAAAITGFRAMQDTFEIKFTKGNDRITEKYKDQKVAVNFESATGLPSASLSGKTPITYTFNGKESSAYMVKLGEGFATSSYPAIIAVTANIPESDNYLAMTKTVTFIIGGDSTLAMNKDEYYSYINGTTIAMKPIRNVQNSLKASMNGSMLQFTTKNTGLVKVDIYDALGASVKQMSDIYGKGSHAIDLKGLPNGSYTLVIRQGSHKASLRWTNK